METLALSAHTTKYITAKYLKVQKSSAYNLAYGYATNITPAL